MNTEYQNTAGRHVLCSVNGQGCPIIIEVNYDLKIVRLGSTLNDMVITLSIAQFTMLAKSFVSNAILEFFVERKVSMYSSAYKEPEIEYMIFDARMPFELRSMVRVDNARRTSELHDKDGNTLSYTFDEFARLRLAFIDGEIRFDGYNAKHVEPKHVQTIQLKIDASLVDASKVTRFTLA